MEEHHKRLLIKVLLDLKKNHPWPRWFYNNQKQKKSSLFIKKNNKITERTYGRLHHEKLKFSNNLNNPQPKDVKNDKNEYT